MSFLVRHWSVRHLAGSCRCSYAAGAIALVLLGSYDAGANPIKLSANDATFSASLPEGSPGTWAE
jgi:hypothetical protein